MSVYVCNFFTLTCKNIPNWTAITELSSLKERVKRQCAIANESIKTWHSGFRKEKHKTSAKSFPFPFPSNRFISRSTHSCGRQFLIKHQNHTTKFPPYWLPQAHTSTITNTRTRINWLVVHACTIIMHKIFTTHMNHYIWVNKRDCYLLLSIDCTLYGRSTL